MSALHVAYLKGHAPLVRTLLDLGADPNSADKVSSAGHIREVDSAEAAGWRPLHYAAANPKIAAMLIDAGADVALADESGFQALHCAVRLKNLPCMKLLIEAGADVNAVGATRTPLMNAAGIWGATDEERQETYIPPSVEGARR